MHSSRKPKAINTIHISISRYELRLPSIRKSSKSISVEVKRRESGTIKQV